MRKRYIVEVTERTKTVVVVEAGSRGEAEKLAEEKVLCGKK